MLESHSIHSSHRQGAGWERGSEITGRDITVEGRERRTRECSKGWGASRGGPGCQGQAPKGPGWFNMDLCRIRGVPGGTPHPRVPPPDTPPKQLPTIRCYGWGRCCARGRGTVWRCGGRRGVCTSYCPWSVVALLNATGAGPGACCHRGVGKCSGGRPWGSKQKGRWKQGQRDWG